MDLYNACNTALVTTYWYLVGEDSMFHSRLYVNLTEVLFCCEGKTYSISSCFVMQLYNFKSVFKFEILRLVLKCIFHAVWYVYCTCLFVKRVPKCIFDISYMCQTIFKEYLHVNCLFHYKFSTWTYTYMTSKNWFVKLFH